MICMTPSFRSAIFDIRLDIRALNHGVAFGCRNEESVGNRGEVGVLIVLNAFHSHELGKENILSNDSIKYTSRVEPLFFRYLERVERKIGSSADYIAQNSSSKQ